MDKPLLYLQKYRIVSVLALSIFVSGCDSGISSKAGAKPSSIDDQYVQAFMGSCVLAFPDLNRIEAAAKVGQWKRVTDPAMLKVLAPQDDRGRWKAWAVKNDKRPYMLAIGDNTVSDKPVRFCSFMAEVPDPQAMGIHLAEMLNAVETASDKSAGQEMRIFEFDHMGDKRLLVILDAKQMGMNMINVTVFSDWKAS